VNTSENYPGDESAVSGAHDGPSKSALKRQMTALQDLGAELVALSSERLKKIDMPETLRDAIRDAQRFARNEAKRRQMQYIGKLMRGIETAPLQAAMDEIKGVSAAANIRQHQLERLRNRLMEDDAVCSEIARDYPGADLQHLRQLRRNAVKETEQNKPPRAYRELFRALRDLVEKPGADDTAGAGPEITTETGTPPFD
jgi:ribosome-associated protein